MITKKIKTEETSLKLVHNNNLPNVWIDAFTIGVRDDGIASVSLFTNLQDGHYEQTRFMCSEGALLKLANSILDTHKAHKESQK